MLTMLTQHDSIQHPTNISNTKHTIPEIWKSKMKSQNTSRPCANLISQKNKSKHTFQLPPCVRVGMVDTPPLCSEEPELQIKIIKSILKVFLKLCKDRNANFIEKNCSRTHAQISVTNHWRCEVERKKIFTAVKMENVNEQKQLGMLFREAICHSGCRKQNKGGGNWGWDVDVVHVVVKCNYYYYYL